MIVQQSLQQQQDIGPPVYANEKVVSSKSHRRMSSIGQSAMLADMVVQPPPPPEHEPLRAKDSYADDADSEPSFSDSKRLSMCL